MKRLVLIALALVAFPAAGARADTYAPDCPSGIDTWVLNGHDIQGNPQLDPLLTCRYTPGPGSSGADYAIEVDWVTPKASPDQHPFYRCGQTPPSPAVVVSPSYEAYARVNTSSAPPDFLSEAGKVLKAVEAGYARSCGAGAPVTGDKIEKPDTTPPRIQAITSYGPRTAAIRLGFHVSDNSGEARVFYGVYTPDGKRLLARGATGFGKVSWRARRWISFKPPKGMVGTYQFCVVALDRAGVRSALSCATLDIRRN